MILGVAQLVVNVDDLDPVADRLRGDGYEESFAERGIPNHPAKRGLQAEPRETLDMVHFAVPGGMAVELTAYAGGPPAGRAAFQFDPPPPGARARVEVAAADAEAGRRFWRDALGFRETGDGSLSFAALRPEWALDVELRGNGEQAGTTTVDAAGCVLVTVLTTSLDDDLARLAGDELVLRSTAPWDESVAGRALRVAMVEGPNGELIELIQLPRQT